MCTFCSSHRTLSRMISAPNRSSRIALTVTAFQRDTSSSSCCASGSLWIRVAKCAHLCATVCSSVCAFLRGVRMCLFISWTIRHLAARYELRRVSGRARDAAQGRVVLRHVLLDQARPAKVDWTYILYVTERLPPNLPSLMCLSCCLSHRRHVRCTPYTRPHALPRRGFQPVRPADQCATIHLRRARLSFLRCSLVDYAPHTGTACDRLAGIPLRYAQRTRAPAQHGPSRGADLESEHSVPEMRIV